MTRVAVALLLLAVSCSPGETATLPTRRVESTAVPTPSPTPTATPIGTPTPDFPLASALAHARTLAAEIGNRMSGTEGDVRAKDYLVRALAAAGLDVEVQEFGLPQGGVSWNVVGVPAGLDRERQRYLMVGAHYDSLNGPGANDNASGTGAAVAVAEALRARPAALPVVVVAFGAEERQPVREVVHHVGSLHYVDGMSPAERANLVALLNLDMLGRGGELICGRMRVGPREATRRLLGLAAELGIPARERVTPDWSDNGSFLRAGMNAGWLWTGEDPAYHSPRDTFDRLQPQALERAGRLSLAFLHSYDR